MCLGVFCTVVPSENKGFEAETLAAARLVVTGRHNDAVSVLLAHVVATRSLSPVVIDADMDYPRDWRTRGSQCADVGHQDAGRTVALHSVAVLPKMQGVGLGKMVITSYLQQMNGSGLADRMALLCQDVCALRSSIRPRYERAHPVTGRLTNHLQVPCHVLQAIQFQQPREKRSYIRRWRLA